MTVSQLNRIVPIDRYHPIYGPSWLSQANGLTITVQTLSKFNNSGAPSALLPPLVDERLFYPRPLNVELRRKLGIPRYHVVIVYTGNAHAANMTETRMLYQAVQQLNERGCPTTLIRTGEGLDESNIKNQLSTHVTNLGWVERPLLPEVLSAADFFVQPGQSDQFNDFRLPSKLLEWFAIGRPIILPRTNLGRQLTHGRDALVLARATSREIAEAILRLKSDRKLSERLASNAVDFYLKWSSEQTGSAKVRSLYRRILQHKHSKKPHKAFTRHII